MWRELVLSLSKQRISSLSCMAWLIDVCLESARPFTRCHNDKSGAFVVSFPTPCKGKRWEIDHRTKPAQTEGVTLCVACHWVCVQFPHLQVHVLKCRTGWGVDPGGRGGGGAPGAQDPNLFLETSKLQVGKKTLPACTQITCHVLVNSYPRHPPPPFQKSCILPWTFQQLGRGRTASSNPPLVDFGDIWTRSLPLQGYSTHCQTTAPAFQGCLGSQATAI